MPWRNQDTQQCVLLSHSAKCREQVATSRRTSTTQEKRRFLSLLDHSTEPETAKEGKHNNALLKKSRSQSTTEPNQEGFTDNDAHPLLVCSFALSSWSLSSSSLNSSTNCFAVSNASKQRRNHHHQRRRRQQCNQQRNQRRNQRRRQRQRRRRRRLRQRQRKRTTTTTTTTTTTEQTNNERTNERTNNLTKARVTRRHHVIHPVV